MSRPLTTAQTLENRAFLKALERTGNIREAARAIRRSPATLHHRRGAHPAFAQRWDAAITVAQARLNQRGGKQGPRGGPVNANRTQGGEPVVVQRRDGKLQLRRAQPGKLTKQCEQAFLAALSATANVRLSAAAAGASPRAFYRRRRTNPGFAREMQLALETGYERLEMALMQSFMVEAHDDDAWHNDPPPIPKMTPEQALQLLYLHHKTAKLWAEAPYMNTRRGETSEMWSMRRAADYRAQQARDAERLRMAETDRVLTKELNELQRELQRERRASLPALDQVKGWSKADPAKAPHDPKRALFGGWRIEDMKRRKP